MRDFTFIRTFALVGVALAINGCFVCSSDSEMHRELLGRSDSHDKQPSTLSTDSAKTNRRTDSVPEYETVDEVIPEVVITEDIAAATGPLVVPGGWSPVADAEKDRYPRLQPIDDICGWCLIFFRRQADAKVQQDLQRKGSSQPPPAR